MVEETENCGRKRKGFQGGDERLNRKFLSPVVITSRDGKIAMKVKSRLCLDPVFACDSGDSGVELKQRFLTRISQAECLLNSKKISSSDSLLDTLCVPGSNSEKCYTTPGRPNRSTKIPISVALQSPMNPERTPVAVSKSIGFQSGTPAVQQRPRPPMSGRKMKLQASRHLSTIENQVLHVSKKEIAQKELWMDRQERAYTAWLNHLLRQPMYPNSKVLNVGVEAATKEVNGWVNMDSWGSSADNGSFSIDNGNNVAGRCPVERIPVVVNSRTPWQQVQKRRRLSSKGQLALVGGLKDNKDQSSETHLRQICSASELHSRLLPHLEPCKCDEIISIMMHLAKHIDKGRLRMKADCAILADISLREKALQVLLNYNPAWLWLGLGVVLGHTAFRPKDRLLVVDEVKDKGSQTCENALLELLLERHFFADASLARLYASNKSVKGLYRDGYYESLGKVILKRFFLLVLFLDKAKCETVLHNAHGIDGLDGGSPLLFQRNTSVKSSHHALEDFLSDALQGEGDLIGHLGKLGYHVSHIQAPLCEYNFEVGNLVEDLQDGVRLCRLAQLMSHDVSLLVKIEWPCHVRKRRLHNCEVAFRALAHAGVPLLDEHGDCITADHIVDGHRDRALPLLWNIMLHLQLPQLVSQPKLWQEIIQLQGSSGSPAMRPSFGRRGAVLDLLLAWVQAICLHYGAVMVNDFTTSFADAQALCYIISFYLPSHLPYHAILPTSHRVSSPGARQEIRQHRRWEGQDLLREDYKVATAHNYGMVERVVKKLGNIPEVLQLSDLVDGDPCTNERNVIIYVAYICSELFGSSQHLHVDEVIETSVDGNGCNPANEEESAPLTEHLARGYSHIEKAAIQIQAKYKALLQQRLFTNRKIAVTTLQAVVRGWLVRRALRILHWQEENAAVVIQAHYRGWFQRIHLKLMLAHVRRLQAWSKMHQFRKRFLLLRIAALKIQQHWRGMTARRKFLKVVKSVVKIQSCWRGHEVQQLVVEWRKSATVIQSCYQGYVQRKVYKLDRAGIVRIQAIWRGKLLRQKVRACGANATKIQASWRGLSVRRTLRKWGVSATRIQTCFRGYLQRKSYQSLRTSIIRLQALARGILARDAVKSMKEEVIRLYACLAIAAVTIQARWRGHQAYWRGALLRLKIQQMNKVIVKIQACIRGRIGRQRLTKQHQAACRIQAVARDWLAQKEALSAIVLVHKTTYAIKIQATWRRYWRHKIWSQKSQAVTKIQAAFRSWHQRKVVRQMHKTPVQGNHVRHDMADQLAREHSHSLEVSAATTMQANWRGYVVGIKPLILAREGEYRQCRETDTARNLPDLARFRKIYSTSELEAGQILNMWARSLHHRVKFLRLRRLAIVIQRYFRGWQVLKSYALARQSAVLIQAHWRGHVLRRGHSHMKQQLHQLRQRMQATAATVNHSQRLGNRLTEALALLLSQKTVSGILHICATIDLVTEHSKQCCEWLAEGGAITKLLQLIQTTNRSPPHEQVLKHALSILANLACVPHLITHIVEAPGSINIIAEQLHMFRNNEEVFGKAVKILQHVCSIPAGSAIIRSTPLLLRRLQHVAHMLERKIEVEKRNLERQSTHSVLKKAAEQKVTEMVLHCHSITSMLAVLGPGKQWLISGSLRRPEAITTAYKANRGKGFDSNPSRFALQDRSNH